MADSVSKEKRSEIMSRISSKNTRLEIDFRKQIWKSGIRYKLHYKILGKPDIAFPSKKIAVFIDSCFWHNCPKHCRKPKSNENYWNEKLKGNAKQDRKITSHLKKAGWKVLRLWEHEIAEEPDKSLERITRILSN